MFWTTYKVTMKTLLRSTLLWVALLLVVLIITQCALRIHVNRALVENDILIGTISDKDPEFREYMNYDYYVQTLQNSQGSWLMIYVMPIFAVISTVLVISRNFSDNFYEIEKSSGIKTRHYYWGRIAAIISINIMFGLLMGFVGIHTYFFTRGGPPVCFNSIIEYFADSSIRVLRIFFCAGVLTLLFYISITYMVGSFLRNGFGGAIVGFANVLFVYATMSFLRLKMPAIYLDYLSPFSLNYYSYWGTYDSELFYHLSNTFKTTDVLICAGFLLGSSILFFSTSFICAKTRNI